VSYPRPVERKGTLTPAEARRAAGHAAELLARDRRILLVYVFGSTLDTRRARVGDVDLGVLAEPPLSLDELTRRQADLRQATGSPIELISLDVAPVILVHEVVESGACLFARDPDTGPLVGLQALPRGAVAARGGAPRGAVAWSLGPRRSASASCGSRK